MQKLGIRQTQQAKLSPKQLQFVQMLQVPTEVLRERIQEEVANNPTLEEEPKEENTVSEEVSILDSSQGYPTHLNRRQTRNTIAEEELQHKYGTRKPSWHEKLLEQLSWLSLTPKERTIAHYLVGSLSTYGYLHTSLDTITYNLSFTHYLEVDTKAVESVLERIQKLDPPGIGARDLRECLLIQLRRKRKDAINTLAIALLTHCFDAFSKKNYRKIMDSLAIEDESMLKKAITAIKRLSPKPIIVSSEEEAIPQRRPDFIVQKNEHGVLAVSLYRDYTPNLRVRKQYEEIFKRYHRRKDKESTEVAQFVKDKIQRAQWFIESIHKRKETLLRTMQAIVKLQKPFFESQDEQKLRPLFMRHVAEEIGMDVSTVSRAVSGKSVTTDFGTFSLKYFFSEAMVTTTGDEASSRTIKTTLQALIDGEDKHNPYTDEALVMHMKERGYVLARRTIAKYRGQLGLPVARMRKEL